MVSAIVLVAVALDQMLKVYIKTHFMLGEAHPVTSWFWLCFVENNGMAFGIEWFSKLALTLFRIAVVGLLAWYVHVLIRRQEDTAAPQASAYGLSGKPRVRDRGRAREHYRLRVLR